MSEADLCVAILDKTGAENAVAVAVAVADSVHTYILAWDNSKREEAQKAVTEFVYTHGLSPSDAADIRNHIDSTLDDPIYGFRL